jgi:hypothetical protein
MFYYTIKILKKNNISFLKENVGYVLKGPLGFSLPIPYNKDIEISLDGSFLLLKSSKASILSLYKKEYLILLF